MSASVSVAGGRGAREQRRGSVPAPAVCQYEGASSAWAWPWAARGSTYGAWARPPSRQPRIPELLAGQSSSSSRRRAPDGGGGLPTLVSQEVSQGHLLHLLVLGRCAVCQPWLPHFEAVQSGAKKPPHRTLPALSPWSVPMIAVCRQRAANFRALSECVRERGLLSVVVCGGGGVVVGVAARDPPKHSRAGNSQVRSAILVCAQTLHHSIAPAVIPPRPPPTSIAHLLPRTALGASHDAAPLP